MGRRPGPFPSWPCWADSGQAAPGECGLGVCGSCCRADQARAAPGWLPVHEEPASCSLLFFPDYKQLEETSLQEPLPRGVRAPTGLGLGGHVGLGLLSGPPSCPVHQERHVRAPSGGPRAGGHSRSGKAALTGAGWPSFLVAMRRDCPGNVTSGTHVLALPGPRASGPARHTCAHGLGGPLLFKYFF